MPKPKKGKKKNEQIIPDVDWTLPELFKENVSIVYIECCRKCFVFTEQANLFFQMLCAQFPEREFRLAINSVFKLGENAPREDSFEITVAQNAKLPNELVWSGIAGGPPRREKFSPDYANVWPVIQQIVTRKLKQLSIEHIDAEVPEL